MSGSLFSPTRRFLNTADNFRASIAHFVNRLRAITRAHVNGAHRISQRVHPEAFAQPIENGVLDTIIGCQSANPNFLDLLLTQQLSKVSAVESRVAVGALIDAL